MEGAKKEGFSFRHLQSEEIEEYIKPIHDLELRGKINSTRNAQLLKDPRVSS